MDARIRILRFRPHGIPAAPLLPNVASEEFENRT